MVLYPAIDIMGGSCVRLTKGDFDTKKVYFDDPVFVAKQFVSEGAKRLHIVNLDGAGGNLNTSDRLLEHIRKAVDIPIQIGGGIRSLKTATDYLNMGYEIVLGSWLTKSPKIISKLVSDYPGRIIASIDCKDGIMATDGWQNSSGIKRDDMIRSILSMGIKRMVYTDIDTDGMFIGPNINVLETIMRSFDVELIASGGVGSLKDLKKLNAMNIYGCIVGKALYEERFTLVEALEVSNAG
ncbi:MAG: 1-(5-phosphoribosyl)-5-[(5-phosphoribosylamino)methylideneamino]imidazole-4-carboxamide isomerase [Clostridia bacterium]|nr:1-(5-phosphoribosyl)-5-[(5-phosphoribosylamino)methylideneamino]imidazole-4-carboxamide isomerase [Clostridia bacterium]